MYRSSSNELLAGSRVQLPGSFGRKYSPRACSSLSTSRTRWCSLEPARIIYNSAHDQLLIADDKKPKFCARCICATTPVTFATYSYTEPHTTRHESVSLMWHLEHSAHVFARQKPDQYKANLLVALSRATVASGVRRSACRPNELETCVVRWVTSPHQRFETQMGSVGERSVWRSARALCASTASTCLNPTHSRRLCGSFRVAVRQRHARGDVLQGQMAARVSIARRTVVGSHAHLVGKVLISSVARWSTFRSRIWWGRRIERAIIELKVNGTRLKRRHQLIASSKHIRVLKLCADEGWLAIFDFDQKLKRNSALLVCLEIDNRKEKTMFCDI